MGERGQEVVLGAVLRLRFAIAPLGLGGVRRGPLFGDVAERDDGAERLAVRRRASATPQNSTGKLVPSARKNVSSISSYDGSPCTTA